MQTPTWITLIGIGEEGYSGLAERARTALHQAQHIVAAPRHWGLVCDHLDATGHARWQAWPSPFSLQPLLAQRPAPVCVLASGDPMFYGVGASLARAIPAAEIQVIPTASSCSWAAARMGWPLQDVNIISLVGRPLSTLNAHLYPGARLLILASDGNSPAQIAALLEARGFGASALSVLEHLGGAQEHRHDGFAHDWCLSPPTCAALNIVAVECAAEPGTWLPALTSGLSDEAFRHDGQLTKRDVRALTLGRLAPRPGQLLWDVGAGCGSIGIEWMRSHPSCRAIAIEAHAGRQAFIEHNRDTLGVPGLQLVRGKAPEALRDLPVPDVIFIGGGVTAPGVIETCWEVLPAGGRLVANAVTLQSAALLADFHARHGGELLQVSLSHAQTLGAFDVWRANLPITLLEARKP